MSFFLQIAVGGISVGAIYGLVASGFSLTYLATERFNFALGMWVMLGAMLAYSFIELWQLPAPIALVAVLIVCYTLGWLAELISVRPFRKTKNDLWIVATLAVGFILTDVAQIVWGTYPLRVQEYFGASTIQLSGIAIRTQQILIFVSLIFLVIAFEYFIRLTKGGLIFRAVAADKLTAELMGIQPRRVEQFAFGLSAAIAGLAGFLIVPIVNAEATIGTALGFKGFAVAIAGGLIAPRGALIFGVLYGFTEALISAYLFDGIKDIIAFSLIILILYILPFGIFGDPEREAR